MTVTPVEFVLRSLGPSWNYARWVHVADLFVGAPDTTL
jgi:hypothetical protein